jgi:peptidoglycan-N-acetylglucosamine deacetylase
VVTPRVLEILRKYNIKATFFFIGKQIEGNEVAVLLAHEEGHLVLNHSWSHPRFSQMAQAAIAEEITKTEEVLTALIGQRPLLMRPPYGDVNDEILQTLKSLGYKSIIWSIDTCDWSDRTAAAIVANVIQNVRPGDIILMHSNSDKMATAEALPLIIETLLQNGYSFATVADILADSVDVSQQ